MRIIAGKFKGTNLKAPKGLNTRPTPSRMRETVFNMLQNKIAGCTFLDLFSGSGLTGFEAISRGASSTTFVDNSFQSIQCIKSNAEKLGIDSDATIIKGDVIEYLERCAKQKRTFDIIYVDPPYETNTNYKGKIHLLSELVLHLIDEHSLLHNNGILFIEEGCKLNTEPLNHLKFDRTKSCGKATLHIFSNK
ncbi:MAG: 16S rRNA (guanine(966)-N(2))-methyltransferase RsmD [Chlamydiota bacterium]